MIKKYIVFLVIMTIPLFLWGCIFMVAGAVGALGGYAISNDTIQGEIDKTFESIWKNSREVLEILGSIITEDKARGFIEAKVNGANVKIMIEQLTPKTTRFRVSARKYLLPKINLAQTIYIKVVQKAK